MSLEVIHHNIAGDSSPGKRLNMIPDTVGLETRPLHSLHTPRGASRELRATGYRSYDDCHSYIA